MDVEDDLLYTKEHEWISIDGDTATIGISDYAQEQLGDITFVELPSVGEEVEQFGEIATVESVKAASEIYSPMSGEVLEVNSDLEEDPGVINKSCYDKGWLVKIALTDKEEASNLMNADEYSKYLQSIG